MKSKLLLLGFLLVLLSSFASADWTIGTTNLTNYYTLDNANTSGTTSIGWDNKGNATLVNGLVSGSIGIINEGYKWDGSNDYMVTATDWFSGTEEISINFWINTNTTTDDVLLDKGGVASTNRMFFRLNRNSSSTIESGQIQFFGSNTTSNNIAPSVNPNINDGAWHMITFVRNSSHPSGAIIYIDGVIVATDGSFPTGDVHDDTKHNMGIQLDELSRPFDGNMDEWAIWTNHRLTPEEVVYQYNNGTPNFPGQRPPFPVPPSGENESVERTFKFNQSGTVTITGNNYLTITNNTFNISVLGDIYFGYRHSVESTVSTKMECRINVDNNFLASEINRSISTDIGTQYILTEPFNNASIGEHWSALQCRRIGGGNIDVSNILGIGHYLIDNNNNTIPHNNIHLENITVNSSTFVEIGNINLSVTSINLSTHTRSVIFNWAEEVEYNVDGEVDTLIQVDGVNCSIYPRFGSVGTSGNIGGDCVSENVSGGSNLNFTILIKGDATINHFHGTLKEFVADPGEVISQDLTFTNITSNTLTNVLNISFNNTDHAELDLFFKAGIPSKSNTVDTDAFYQFRVSGTESFNGTIFEQRAKVNNTVLVIQEIFENLSIGTYQIELWASCANSDCTVTGGDLVAYITDATPAPSVSIEVRAFDFFDNSSILNFTVAVEGGVNFSTTTGVVNVIHPEQFANLTFTSDFNGGYFPFIFLNHNGTMGDLNQTLNQTEISWNCVEKVSGNNLNCSAPLETVVFNYNVVGNPHTQSLNVTSYFENQTIFSVTALQNETLNVSFFSTNLTINSSATLLNLTTCTYNVTGITHPTFFESISNTVLNTVGLINGTYTVVADCVAFALAEQNVTINLIQQTLNFSLVPTNSINFTFRDEDTPLVILNGTNVSFSLIWSTNASNHTTSVGWSFLDDLIADDYEIKYTALGFDDRSFFFTITEKSTQTITLYLGNSTDTTLYIVRVADESDSDVVGAKVQLQRQYVEFGGQFVTIEECETNDVGECDMFIQESSSINYRFNVIIDGVIVKTTDPTNIVNVAGVTTKQIVIRVNIGTSFLTAYDGVTGLFGDLSFDNETNFVNYTFLDSRNTIIGGCLVVERNNFFNLTKTTVFTSCVSGFSGNINNVNLTSFIVNNTMLTVTGLVNFTNSNIELDSFQINTVSRGANNDENSNLIFTIIFFVLISFATVMIPNMLIQTILNFGLMFGLAFFGFNLLGTTLILLFMSIGLILNYNKKNIEGGVR